MNERRECGIIAAMKTSTHIWGLIKLAGWTGCLLLIAWLPLSAAKDARLVRLTVWNRTELPLTLRMQNVCCGLFFYLYVSPGQERTFTIEPQIYKTRIWGCNSYKDMDLSITQQTHLTVVPCGQNTSAGERGQLKLSLGSGILATPYPTPTVIPP